MSDQSPLYIAFERVEHKRNMQTMERYKVVAEKPGPAHALDVMNTREQHPWRMFGSGRPLAGEHAPHFYDHRGPRAACGRTVKVATPTEFETDAEGACPECVELVRSGKAWGRYDPYPPGPCSAQVRIEEDGEIEVYDCNQREYHDGPHRSKGATWETGSRDFTPPPDGYV